MNKIKLIRHGDLTFQVIDSLPNELTKSNSNVILQAGSGGNPHSFKGGTFYPETERNVIGYLEAKNTILYHPDHGKKKNSKGLKESKIPNGYYKIIRQIEFRENGEEFVED